MAVIDKSVIIESSADLPNEISKKIFVSVGVIKLGNLLLLSYRDLSKEQGGFWEFPGGKRQPGESSLKALYREFLEELDIKISNAKKINHICYLYDEKIFVSLDVWLINDFSGIPKNAENQEIKWFEINNFDSVQMTKPNRLIYDTVTKYNSEECIV